MAANYSQPISDLSNTDKLWWIRSCKKVYLLLTK